VKIGTCIPKLVFTAYRTLRIQLQAWSVEQETVFSVFQHVAPSISIISHLV